MSDFIKSVLLCSALAFGITGSAQKRDTAQQQFMGFDLQKERKLTILPTVYYKPETNWAFGVSALMYRRLNKSDSISPLSLAGLSFAYTLNNQTLFSMPFRIFFKEDNYRLNGEISYYRYPYFFAGIGTNRRLLDEQYTEDYDASFPRVAVTGLKKFKTHFFTGPKLFYQHTTINSVKQNGLLDTLNVPGTAGSVTTGVGWELVFDKRDFVYAPTKGFYSNISFIGFNKAMGGNFEYNLFSADIRKYVNLGNEHVLAMQLFGSSIFGTAPFNKLAQLGGEKIMRGYRKGILRDNHLLASQIEYRTPIWYFIGLTAFAGTGAVSSEINNFKTENFVPSYGGGLRLAFNKKERIHIRFDYARGLDRNQFYLTFAEAF